MNGGPGKRERILLGWLFPVVRGPERRDTRRKNGMPEEMSDRNLSNHGHNIKCAIVIVKNDEIETCYRTSVHILRVLLVSEDCYVAMGCLHPADQWVSSSHGEISNAPSCGMGREICHWH